MACSYNNLITLPRSAVTGMVAHDPSTWEGSKVPSSRPAWAAQPNFGILSHLPKKKLKNSCSKSIHSKRKTQIIRSTRYIISSSEDGGTYHPH